MVQKNGYALPYDKYDKFVLFHRSDSGLITDWCLIGIVNRMYGHFIANSDNEEELRVWADVNNMKMTEDEDD